jgi:hypothetical protein
MACCGGELYLNQGGNDLIGRWQLVGIAIRGGPIVVDIGH